MFGQAAYMFEPLDRVEGQLLIRATPVQARGGKCSRMRWGLSIILPCCIKLMTPFLSLGFRCSPIACKRLLSSLQRISSQCISNQVQGKLAAGASCHGLLQSAAALECPHRGLDAHVVPSLEFLPLGLRRRA